MNLNIKSERVRTGLSAEDLSHKLGVSTRTYYSWERGESKITFDNAVRLAEYFGCSVDYLAGLTNERVIK